jgi:peptide/nickel transport system ATP-binding protein
MYQGDIVEQAPVRELFAAPREDYTKRLLAAVPHVGRGKSARQAAEPGSAAVTSAPEDALVVAKGLQIAYPGRFGRPGVVAVKGVDLWIAPGEVLGLVGESGSGKTTIGRAIVGLTQVVGGSLTVLGHEMRGTSMRALKKLRPDIGFVFQDPATSFNPLLTIAECVAEPLVVHGRASDPRAARGRVDALLDAVHLPTSYGDRYPHELSGGQRQRASLARAIALEPKLLIADEPTSALDVSVQARVLELFSELQERLGFACLFISHDLAVIDEVADRIVVLRRGMIREQGTTAQVLGDAKDDYTRRLLASIPVPDPEQQAARRAAWVAAQVADDAEG